MSLYTERVHLEAALAAILATMGGGAGGAGAIPPTRQSAIDFIKAKLDEIIPGGEGFTFALSAEPNISNPLDLLINAHLDEATKNVILSAPISVLFPTLATDAGVANTDAKTGYVVLPDNFLRLSSFKMTDWLTDIDNPITPKDPKYKKQSNQFLRGGLSKPVAVLTWKSVANVMKRVLEYYSVDTAHTVEKLLYIPETTAEDFIAVNPNLLDALAWMTASKIMQITGMSDAAKLAQERVTQSYTNL